MSYFTRIFDALRGRPSLPRPGTGDPAAAGRIATLEMDLRERDERIATMQKEYARLEAAGKRAAAGAGAEELAQLFKKLAAPLSTLAALEALAAQGREVAVGDVLGLLRTIDKHFRAAGLEPVGAVGVSLPFDIALHQRMSGGSVSPGTPVTVQTPGYRFGGKILLKAMVTAKEARDE